MSYDLMVFEKTKAPAAKKDFMAWYEKQTEWSEEFLKWLLRKTIYDFDKAEEEKCQWIQKRKEIINEPSKNIIYL